MNTKLIKLIALALCAIVTLPASASYQMRFASKGVVAPGTVAATPVSPPGLTLGAYNFGNVALGDAAIGGLKATLANTTASSITFSANADISPNNVASASSAAFVPFTTTTGGPVMRGTCAVLTSLAPGASCTLGVKFLAPAVGSYSATLSVPTSAGTVYAPLLASVSLPAQLVFSETSWDFGQVHKGTTVTRAILVSNTGGMSTQITYTPSSPTELTGCSAELAPGATCTLQLALTPRTDGLLGVLAFPQPLYFGTGNGQTLTSNIEVLP